MAEFAWHVTGQEAQNLPAQLIDAEKSWATRKSLLLQVRQQIVLQVPVACDRPSDRFANSGHATSANQRCLCVIH